MKHCPKLPASDWPQSANSATWGQDSVWRLWTWKYEAQATCLEENSTDTSRPSASTCTASCWSTRSRNCAEKNPEEEISTSINLNLDIRIPEAYIADSSQRLRMYKRISSAATDEELDALRQEMVDRFGPYPEPVENLFRYARLRQETLALQIQSVEKNKNQVFFRFVDHSKVSAEKLMKLVTRNKNATFSPQGLLTLDVPEMPPTQLFSAINKILEEIRL